MSHGGARKGAGRKPLPKDKKAVTGSINLLPAIWDKLDRLRGDQSRSKFLAAKIHRMKE